MNSLFCPLHLPVSSFMCNTANVYRDPWIIPVRGSDLAGLYGRSCMETIHALKGYLIRAFSMLNLMSQTVKNLPAMQETRVPSLDREEPWEKGMATYSSILAWKIPWAEEPGRLQAMGSQRVGHNWATNTRQQWVVITDYLPAEKYRRKKKI